MQGSKSIGSIRKFLLCSGRDATKHLAILALMFTFSVAASYARDQSVKMTFSGTSETSPTSLQQPDTSNDGDNFAGTSTLGSFTVRNIRAISNVPGESSSCSGTNDLFLPELAGASVIRFGDGSLLEMNLTQGGDCIDLTTGLAHCVLTLQIIGGTGRFKHAAGVLTMDETVSAVAFDALGNPVLFAATGAFTGTVSGLPKADGRPEGRQ